MARSTRSSTLCLALGLWAGCGDAPPPRGERPGDPPASPAPTSAASPAPTPAAALRVATAPAGARFEGLWSEGGALRATTCATPCAPDTRRTLIAWDALAPDAPSHARCGGALPVGVREVRTLADGRTYAIAPGPTAQGYAPIVTIDRDTCAATATLWSVHGLNTSRLFGDEQSDRLVVRSQAESYFEAYTVDPTASDPFVGQRKIDGCSAKMVRGAATWSCSAGVTADAAVLHFRDRAHGPVVLPRSMELVGASDTALFTVHGFGDAVVWSRVELETGVYSPIAVGLPARFTAIVGDERRALGVEPRAIWAWMDGAWTQLATSSDDVEVSWVALPEAIVAATATEIWALPRAPSE